MQRVVRQLDQLIKKQVYKEKHYHDDLINKYTT